MRDRLLSVIGVGLLAVVAVAQQIPDTAFTYRAKQSNFLLQRGGSTVQGTDVGGDAALLPGDVITVQERFF